MTRQEEKQLFKKALALSYKERVQLLVILLKDLREHEKAEAKAMQSTAPKAKEKAAKHNRKRGKK